MIRFVSIPPFVAVLALSCSDRTESETGGEPTESSSGSSTTDPMEGCEPFMCVDTMLCIDVGPAATECNHCEEVPGCWDQVEANGYQCIGCGSFFCSYELSQGTLMDGTCCYDLVGQGLACPTGG